MVVGCGRDGGRMWPRRTFGLASTWPCSTCNAVRMRLHASPTLEALPRTHCRSPDIMVRSFTEALSPGTPIAAMSAAIVPERASKPFAAFLVGVQAFCSAAFLSASLTSRRDDVLRSAPDERPGAREGGGEAKAVGGGQQHRGGGRGGPTDAGARRACTLGRAIA